MLNEVPNSNDIMCVANIMLTKVPNSYDATHVVNNVHLNYHGRTIILHGSYIAIM